MNEVYHAVDPSETSANVGDAVDEQTAVQIVHQAVHGDITFFDNCWEYNRGKSENWMGGST
ncbi:MAG: uncharacterized protein QOH78_2759 [Verrucomicrobiota bacterium]